MYTHLLRMRQNKLLYEYPGGADATRTDTLGPRLSRERKETTKTMWNRLL